MVAPSGSEKADRWTVKTCSPSPARVLSGIVPAGVSTGKSLASRIFSLKTLDAEPPLEVPVTFSHKGPGTAEAGGLPLKVRVFGSKLSQEGSEVPFAWVAP